MASLELLPLELKVQIFSRFSQEDLYSLTLVSTSLSGVAVVQLYCNPIFKTTYRFAQFVSIVSHSRRYADMVWNFNLPERLDDEVSMDSVARWIEWKYRDQPLYAAKRWLSHQFPKRNEKAGIDTHPWRNQLLSKGYGTVPVGSIIQVLVACRNLRVVRLHVIHIESDYLVKSPAYPPTALSSMIFASEVSRSWTHNSKEVEPVSNNTIIQQLPSLLHLDTLHICRAPWLTTDDVENILLHCTHLAHLDFTQSGGLRGIYHRYSWATSGNREKIAEELTLVLRR